MNLLCSSHCIKINLEDGVTIVKSNESRYTISTVLYRIRYNLGQTLDSYLLQQLTLKATVLIHDVRDVFLSVRYVQPLPST